MAVKKAVPAKAPAATEDEQVAISPIARERILVPIVGTSPLIVHRFGEKAKRQMLDGMQGRTSPKEPKNPQAEYEAALYRFKGEDGFGFPAIAFKAATVGGGRFYAKITMVALRQFIFFDGVLGADGQKLVRIVGEPRMREDVAKVGNNKADLRYRPEFPEWTTTLDVTFVTSSITRDSVLSLIDAGGMGVGVGEWRPERKGDFGTFRLDDTRTLEVITGASGR